MNESEFEKLSLDRKCRYVLNHCTFVASRRVLIDKERQCRVNLYHRDQRFYEIWYNSAYDYIGDVRMCTSDVLNAYADQVSLKRLVML